MNIFAQSAYSFTESFQTMVKEGLPIMGVGMVGIFAVIGAIIGAVWLLSKVSSK